ncbi:MAG: Zn-ribbon domain-containing OB-fold protein [Actinomycetota bacterium]
MPEMPKTLTWHLPQPDSTTINYWEAARNGQLLIMACNECNKSYFYPRPFCPHCWSANVAWQIASGEAVVYTFTIVKQNDLPPFKDRLPYVVAIVELKEGVRMTTNIEGCTPEDVKCGMKVRASFRQEGDAAIPIFVPA